jgi:NADPH2:quinone reductase
MIADKYQYRFELPFAPGSEVGGIVKEIGEGVTGFQVGDHVAGSVGHGGFAELALADARRTYVVPKNMDFAVASSFMVTYGTSYYGLKDRANLQPGETLVVLGAAGGVGLAAVDLGRMMGAKVIAGVSSQDKLDTARKFGASDGFIYPPLPLSKEQAKEMTDTIKKLTGGKGADVLYDPVGDAYAEPAVRGMGWNSRYLVIGFAAGQIPKIPLNLALLKSTSIMGVFMGGEMAQGTDVVQKCLKELAQLIADGKLNPYVSERFPLSRGNEAIRHLMDRKAKGKVVVTID